ncbi:MAG: Mur ligase family protein, partial [Parcubacteria group bacterium]
MTNILLKACFAVLIILAKLVLKKYKPKIIAITGSVGKSSTKEAIYTALSRVLSVRKSVDGERAELTTALAILGCGSPRESISKWFSILIEGVKLWLLPNHYPEWLVVVSGSDRPGDINSLCKWMSPDVVIVTRFDRVPVHVEFFPSREALINDKGCLVSSLKKGGKLILNADDKEVLAFADFSDVKPILFGKSKEADVRLLDSKLL